MTLKEWFSDNSRPIQFGKLLESPLWRDAESVMVDSIMRALVAEVPDGTDPVAVRALKNEEQAGRARILDFIHKLGTVKKEVEPLPAPWSPPTTPENKKP